MKICVSIAPRRMSQAVPAVRTMSDQCDLVELRIDAIRNLDLEALLQKPRPPMIITQRMSREGGAFKGPKKKHMDMLSQAIQLGAEYVDIEMSCGRPAVDSFCSLQRTTQIIVSYHNFRQTPSNLASIYRTLRSTNADIVKIAVMANDIADSAEVIRLMKRASRDRKRVIAVAMGERGQVTRVLAAKYGGFLTFASTGSTTQTADGQICLSELRDVYRVHTMNRRTKVFGLAGNPVSRSRGIYFHNRVFHKHAVNAVYVNFLVDDLKLFLSSFRDEFSGLSITMPFKQEVMSMIDDCENRARELGVVNTVVRRRSKLIGYNTDLPAIISLLKNISTLRGKHVVVLGTGAIARTMVHAATVHGSRVTVVGRSEQEARLLASEYGCSVSRFDDLRDIRTDILVNATSVGMNPSTDRRLVPRSFFRKGMIVFDAVYGTKKTPLLRDASSFGCRTISGEEFFNRQASLQSKLFLSSFL